MKNSETFAKAAKHMSENGMHKGNYVDPEGGRAVCLFGACFMANGMTPRQESVYGGFGFWDDNISKVENEVISDLMGVLEDEGIVSEDEWSGHTPTPNVYNDYDETTLEDALLILKKAEVKAREREEKEEASTDEDPEV